VVSASEERSPEKSIDRREPPRQRGEVWREIAGMAMYLVLAALIAIAVVWLVLVVSSS
jgi:hypothetical protein